MFTNVSPDDMIRALIKLHLSFWGFKRPCFLLCALIIVLVHWQSTLFRHFSSSSFFFLGGGGRAGWEGR